jgi:hypothetical protein
MIVRYLVAITEKKLFVMKLCLVLFVVRMKNSKYCNSE